MEEEFQDMQNGFCRDNCGKAALSTLSQHTLLSPSHHHPTPPTTGHFEDGDENKLIYTDIFRQYTDTIGAAGSNAHGHGRFS
jgi:hypothetical protein